jgi:succinyl-CoA synthetase alpha subunit
VPAAKLAVTPLGNPVAASVTVAVNPPRSATEIVLVPLPFCATDTLVGEADNVKLGGTVTVTEAVPVAVL